MSKAHELRALANVVALELESATIGGAMTYKEFVAVLGEDWLGWIPTNNQYSNPCDWITLEQRYEEFTQALSVYRINGKLP